ncbi:MAG: hypothetical protein ACLGI3_20770, partial [Actinomycetes bacterium]
MNTLTVEHPPTPPSSPSSFAPSLLGRVGGWCFDHLRAAIGLWLTALVVIFAAAGVAGAAFGSSSDVPDSDSAAGVAVLQEYFPELGTGGQSGTIVFRADQGVAHPEVVAAMEGLFATVEAGFPDAGGVPQQRGATVVSPYSPQGAAQI